MNQEEIIDKILNKQSLTREEALVVYGEDAVQEMDKQFELNTMTEEEHEEHIQYVFKEQIEQAEEIERLKQNKENQMFDMLSNLQNTISTKKSNSINFETLYQEFVEKKQADDDIGIESYQSYQGTFNFTKKFFENQNLNELNYKNQDDLKIYLQNKESESKGKLLSKVTLNNHIQTLSSFFKFGEDRELLDKNFLKNIKSFKEEKIDKDNYTDEQLLKILSSDIHKFNSYNKQKVLLHNYYNLFKICIFSGCRISEILKLKKENVENDRFHVKDAKTENSNRTVPIHPLLKKRDFTDLIDNLKVKYKNEKEEKKIINYHTKNANKILKKLDIDIKEKQTFHTLRGTFMEKLINKDITKKVLVQMMVGHSIPDEDKLTLLTYAKKIDFKLYQNLMEQFELK